MVIYTYITEDLPIIPESREKEFISETKEPSKAFVVMAFSLPDMNKHIQRSVSVNYYFKL